MKHLVPLLLAPLALLFAACTGEDSAADPAGIQRSTVTPRAPTPAPPPARTPGPAMTVVPLLATPTDVEVGLAALADEDPARLAAAMEELLTQCTDTRAELGDAAARTWRILNEQRGLHVSVSAILGRVIISLPVDGRRLGCQTLFASVVTELSR